MEYFPLVFREFNITHEPIPETVATRIMVYHIVPGLSVRKKLGIPLYPSQNSCWRPYKWEIKQGRSGDSQHCFGQRPDGSFDEDAKGATDWTCDNFTTNKDDLLKLLIEETDYTRFAVYNTFIHCDYANTRSGKREVYNSSWVRQQILNN